VWEKISKTLSETQTKESSEDGSMLASKEKHHIRIHNIQQHCKEFAILNVKYKFN